MRHTLSIRVENRYGELARMVGLISARGLNIESLTVAATLEEAVSCVTLVTSGDEHVIQQIVKQLEKLVRVLGVDRVSSDSHLERELVLVHLQTQNGAALHTLFSLITANGLKVVEVEQGHLVLEATGAWHDMNELISQLVPLGATEI